MPAFGLPWTLGLFIAIISILATRGLHPDQVLHLPGLDEKPNFKHYSGYLKVTEKHYFHYWLVESEKSPESDPLVVWLNGGPGCSSMDGFFTENGPFRIKKGGQELYIHEHRWNKIANMLFLESPVGVGFSYSTDEIYKTDDDLVSHDNLKALKAFFEKFPEYKGRELFITGESYAGIYIPTLLDRIIDDGTIKVKAAAIGNGYMNPNLLDSTNFPFWYYHGLISTTTWQSLVQACCAEGNANNCTFVPFTNEECQYIASKTVVELSSIPLNRYNVYGKCETSVYEATKAARTARMASLMIEQAARKFDDPLVAKKFRAATSETDNIPPCTNSNDMEIYLNNKEVKECIHVRTDLPYWTMCTRLVSRDDNSYTMKYETMKPQFLKIVHHGIKVLVYNGDEDTACNFFGDELFVDDLGLEEISKRQIWYYNSERDESKQIGGFVHRFAGLTYATVKGSGHMVPTDQPVSSYEMFKKFISGVPL